jgi:alkanesulfonate monooxygenase SsuD/methylene tetrahydromethanopterin reductase-like flavin-dependent oxidoreductase (luciferase family)
MQFGLFSHIPWPEGTDPGQILAETTEQVQYGEQLGFQSAWFAEHHFSRYGLGSSSLLILGHIAARTETIRLGTAILVPPLHHPIRLAEETATLDVLSGGRLDVGLGRGSAGYEYNGYEVEQAESQGRFRETIRIVEELWTTPNYSFEGQYFNLNQITLVPAPAQQPPPMYIAATRTPATLEFVVSTGHPLIIGVVLDTPDSPSTSTSSRRSGPSPSPGCRPTRFARRRACSRRSSRRCSSGAARSSTRRTRSRRSAHCR